MKIVNVEIRYIFLILVTSILLSFDLFINIGHPANGDGLIHTLVPNLFAHALSQGNLPVGWTDGFANYGLPLGTVSQQLTTYLSGLVVLIAHNPILGFSVVCFLGTFFSSLFFYIFLRIYFPPLYAYAGIFLFQFAPYRILNIYIRGALPEFFASVFFPLLLISSYLIIVKKNISGFFLFVTAFALLTLTHPFMDIVVLLLLIPYIIFLLVTTKSKQKKSLITTYGITFLSALILGTILTLYYTLPLLMEIKYFYYGQSHNHLTPNNFLTIQNFFTYQYPYFSKLDILNRGFAVNVGVVETVVSCLGFIYVLYRIATKKIFKHLSIIDFTVISGVLVIFMMTSPANFLYSRINFLSNIQFPWRMLSAFIFLPPVVLSFFLTKIDKKIITLICIVIIAFFAFPQLYGKNYTVYPNDYWNFTSLNLDAIVMQTIWTGDSTTYPIASTKAGVIDGKGRIISQHITDNKRIYIVDAQSQLRLVDRTFYFPGWKVFIDGTSTTIEYQDPRFRGVITYIVPPGQHTVTVIYTDTKIRLLGKLLTGAGIILVVVLFFFCKALQNFLVRNAE